MGKGRFINQFAAAVLVPLLAFLPVAGQAAEKPSASAAASVFSWKADVSWQEYLAANLPPTVSGSDRARIHILLSEIENASRAAYRLTTAGLSPEEAASRVNPEVQAALAELVTIGERLDAQAAATQTADNQAAIQQLEEEIVQLKEEVARIEAEIAAARGIKWRIRDAKVRQRKASSAEKEVLKDRERELKSELKAYERELKDLRKAIEKEKDQNLLEGKRARITTLEKLIDGDPSYSFNEKLGEIVLLNRRLTEKEKALATLVPPIERSETSTPFAELARIVTLPEDAVRDFSLASPLPGDKQLIENFRKELKRNYEQKKRDLKNNKEAIEKEKKNLQKALKGLLEKEGPKGVEERGAEMECRIRQIDKARAIYPVKEKALERAYDNFEAKLDFFANWPAKHAELQAKLADKSIYKEKFMDYPLIGVRDLGFGDQADDIRPGMDDEKQIFEELKRMLGYSIEEIKEPRVVAYFESFARIMQQSSDLKVPLRVHVLKTPEINAFAIRGGAIYFFAGLLVADKIAEAAYKKKGLERKFTSISEAMIWGIGGHEIAHITLRHTHRIMKPVTIAQILMQAAQLVIMFGTFGFGLLAYLIYYYGMPFLSLALNLKLLGISREHETEADMVGAQYAYQAGFDPRGNIYWHEWLAKYLGYVRGAGYFYTHPPAYERIWNLERVLAILPPLEGGGRLDSQEFQEIREIIWDILREKEFQDEVEKATKPTLRTKELAEQKRLEERCRPYVEQRKDFDPFDEAPFQTPLAIPARIGLPVVCAAGTR